MGSVCCSLNSAQTQCRPTQCTHVFQEFAREGLRTLIVAYRELDNSFFHDWSKKHSEACLSLENRENKISTIYEEIEKDLMVSVRKPGTDWGLHGGWQSADWARALRVASSKSIGSDSLWTLDTGIQAKTGYPGSLSSISNEKCTSLNFIFLAVFLIPKLLTETK